MADGTAGRIDRTIAAVFVLSGFSALIYQVAWQRALSGIYGMNVESVTVIVTAFMLGLGAGSLAGGVIAGRPRLDLLAVFAIVEGVIGVYGLGSLTLFEWAGERSGAVGPGAVFAATFALVVAPTALMGATLPLLVGHEVRRSRNVGGSLGLLYFANTLGGALAAIVAGTILMRWFGIALTVLCAACVNAGVALLVLAIRRKDRKA